MHARSARVSLLGHIMGDGDTNTHQHHNAKARARAANLMLCARTETTLFNLGGGCECPIFEHRRGYHRLTKPASVLPPSPALFSVLQLPFLGLTHFPTKTPTVDRTGWQMLTLAAPIQVTLSCLTEVLSLGSPVVRTAYLSPLLKLSQVLPSH